MIRLGPKHTEAFISPPEGLKLLVDSIYAKRGTSSGNTKDRDDWKLPDKNTFAGYKYSWMALKEGLDIEKSRFEKNLIKEAQAFQSTGGKIEDFFAERREDIMKFNSYYMNRNMMLDSYWDKMVDDKKSAESIRAAITDPSKNVSGNDYMYNRNGKRATVKDYFPDVDPEEADLPLTLGHYLELSESSMINFDEKGRLITNYSAYELPDMQGLWDLYDETYSSPGSETVSNTFIDRVRTIDRINGKTEIVDANTTKDLTESSYNKIDSFMSRAAMQYPWEWNIMVQDYMEANEDRSAEYMKKYDPKIHYKLAKSPEEFAQYSMMADLRNKLATTQDPKYLRKVHEETTYGYQSTDELLNAEDEASKRITMRRILDGWNIVQWVYGTFNTGGYKTREAMINNFDKLPPELKTPITEGYNTIFNKVAEAEKQGIELSPADARKQYLEGLKENEREQFLKNEIAARKELTKMNIETKRQIKIIERVSASEKPGPVIFEGELPVGESFDPFNPDVYTPLVAKVDVKTEELVNTKHYDLNVNPQLESEYFLKDMRGADIYLIGGVRYSSNPFTMYLYNPTGTNIRFIQGLPDGPGDSNTTPKAVSYMVVEKSVLENMEGIAEGQKYNYWTHRGDLGIIQLDTKRFLETIKDRRINSKLAKEMGDRKRDDYYLVPVMYNAETTYGSFDFGKEK